MKISLEELLGILKDRDEVTGAYHSALFQAGRKSSQERAAADKEARLRVRELEDRVAVLQEERNNASDEVARLLKEKQQALSGAAKSKKRGA